jgi:hypothetical protein
MGTNRQNLLAVVFILLSLPAFSKDFGVLGHVYKIDEQDIIEFIKTSLMSFDIGKLQEEQQQRVHAYVERPREVKRHYQCKGK